jgi:hypothetical protein
MEEQNSYETDPLLHLDYDIQPTHASAQQIYLSHTIPYTTLVQYTKQTHLYTLPHSI